MAVSKHSEHMPLNRQAVVVARHGVPIDRSVLADWMGRTGALIAPVVDHMAKQLLMGINRLYVDETTAPVLDPERGKTKTGYLWAVHLDISQACRIIDRDMHEIPTFDTLFHSVAQTCELFPPDECRNLFKAAGYVAD